MGFKCLYRASWAFSPTVHSLFRHVVDMPAQRLCPLQRKREVWEGPPASSLELHKTLDHLENNDMGIADLAGSLSSPTLQPTLLDDLFGLDSLPDFLSPSMPMSDGETAALNLSALLPSPTSEAHHPLSPHGQATSPAVHSSACSNPPTVAAIPALSQQPTSPNPPGFPFETGQPRDVSSPQGVKRPEHADSASMHWRHALQQAQRPTGGIRVHAGRAGGYPIAPPQHCPVAPSSRRSQSSHPAHPHRTSTLEGFNPFATADAEIVESELPRNLGCRAPSGCYPSATLPPRADAPSPPLRLSLQPPTCRTLQQRLDGYPLPGSMEVLHPPPQTGRMLRAPEGGPSKRLPQSAATAPNGFGSRVVSGCMTSAAMATHEELLGLPLVCGPRTRSISAPIVRQGPAILRSRLKPHRGATGGNGVQSGHPPSSPPAFREPRHHSAGPVRTTPVGMCLPEAQRGLLRSGDPTEQDPTNSLGELDLSSGPGPLRESSSLSWGTVEAIAAGYVPALDGLS